MAKTSEHERQQAEVISGELVESDAGERLRPAATAVRAPLPGLSRMPAPKLQTAAAAATGFVAGAATLALLRRYGTARLERLQPGQQQAQLADPRSRRRPAWPPAEGGSYIVHVRPLSRPE